MSEQPDMSITTLFNALRVIQSAAEDIERIADDLFRVGLDRPSRMLASIAPDLMNAADTIRNAHADDQAQQIAHGQAMTSNLLMLALKTYAPEAFSEAAA